LLSLEKIASWGIEELNDNGIIAEVPILQRGLVWDQALTV
jgi:hypothetical protein